MDTTTPTLPPSTLNSVLTMLATKGLAVLAAFLVTHGVMTGSNTEAFVALAPALVSLGWSAYMEYLRPILSAQLEVLKAKSLAQAAALKAAGAPKVTVAQIAAQSPTMEAPDVVKAIATLPPEIREGVVLPPQAPASAAGRVIPPPPLVLLAIALGALALGYGSPVYAQTPRSRPALTGNPINDIKTDLGQAKAAVTGQPAPDPTAALPCMDITMLPKLTPQNLLPTMKACVQDVNNQLVSDTQRALASAKAFAGSATGSGTGTVIGDNDAINCLTPALALFQAAAIVPAVPEVPAVLNSDGTVKTPAVPGTPELDPGPILLGQKFREFTLAGGLTSCQAWVNEPVQAVTAAAAGNIGAVAGAALLLSK